MPVLALVYRGAAAAIIVFDITSAESFNRAKAWVRELQRQGSPNMIMALAGACASVGVGVGVGVGACACVSRVNRGAQWCGVGLLKATHAHI